MKGTPISKSLWTVYLDKISDLLPVFIFSYLYGYDKNIVSAVAASSHVVTAILFGLIGFWSIAFIGTKLSTVLKIESESSMSL